MANTMCPDAARSPAPSVKTAFSADRRACAPHLSASHRAAPRQRD